MIIRVCPGGRESSSRSSREVRIRVPFSSVVYFRRGTLPQKRGEKGTTEKPSHTGKSGLSGKAGSLGAPATAPKAPPTCPPPEAHGGKGAVVVLVLALLAMVVALAEVVQ